MKLNKIYKFNKKNSLVACAVVALSTLPFITSLFSGILLIKAASQPKASFLHYFVINNKTLTTMAPASARQDALALAYRNRNFALAREIVKSGVDVNPKDSETFPPLYLAASTGDIETALELIKRGADLDASSEQFTRFPLMGAVLGNQIEMTRLLIAKGADVRRHSKFGRSPLAWARQKKFKEIEFILITHGAYDSEKQLQDSKRTPSTIRDTKQ